MSRFILVLILIASTSFASVTPLKEHQKPHSVWKHKPLEHRGFSVPFDEHLNQRLNTDNSGEIQNEEQVCINPLDPDNMVAVWRDFREGYRRIGVGYTVDGGESWSDVLFPQMYYEWQSDPVLVVDHNGVFTANVITFEAGGDGDVGMLSVSSYDVGQQWKDHIFRAERRFRSCPQQACKFCYISASLADWCQSRFYIGGVAHVGRLRWRLLPVLGGCGHIVGDGCPRRFSSPR